MSNQTCWRRGFLLRSSRLKDDTSFGTGAYTGFLPGGGAYYKLTSFNGKHDFPDFTSCEWFLLSDPEVTANLYCNFAYLYWEGCVICSIYLRYTQYVCYKWKTKIINMSNAQGESGFYMLYCDIQGQMSYPANNHDIRYNQDRDAEPICRISGNCIVM